MLIGVISDTHIPDRAKSLPKKVFKVFSDVDMILHCGDLTEVRVKEELESLAPTYCVQGNMDRYYGLKLPKSKIFKLKGFKIGLNHGEVYPRGDTQQLKYIALEMGVDILLSGHTHHPFIEEVDNIKLLNPGSPTVPRFSVPTVMLLNISEKDIEAEIIKVGSSRCIPGK
ncbi:phosphodiesterase, MJ0936 family [Methanothermus fervidus DSM 2088]|uniref:Phosphoesterase n=1 Tax=Methanothermus fervidus (strain ATCC 43054 / DSM 2088 / JCM 10308 / V24 S) TaxID=523846 RepID=E3GY93_METFV|nr:metallophosphoesterase [Methanothermus fervidus]ADP77275.1 phosphodiesterase, MJ0936 family [Methanothermus fervidus DSM 2088]